MTKAEKYMLKPLTALSSPYCDLATAFSREEDKGLQKGGFLAQRHMVNALLLMFIPGSKLYTGLCATLIPQRDALCLVSEKEAGL